MDSKALFNIGYGLYLLTAKDGDKHNGCIINTVMQVTSAPIIIAIGVNKQNYTHDMILKTKEFNISILTENTPFDVFKHFGFQSGRIIDKFANYENKLISENGLIYLSKCVNSYISGKVIDVIDFGTHSLFKAEVTDANLRNNDETVTYNYYQKHIKPKPQAVEKKGWRCNICGYIYEGETLPPDFVCPICKHGAMDFSKI
jgi:flavin reductase (DIM6/NTAB) family NADH-FMN oxidoreductase RutF